MNVPWRVDFRDEVDSTNVRAAERVMACWASGDSAHGVVIMARRQAAGRGQHGRAWASPGGGVYMSVVLEDFPEGWRERLALVVGVAVVEALEMLMVRGVHALACSSAEAPGEDESTLKRELRALIRWPNDVLLGGKKVAGILCEGISQGERFAAIVGIGINVATRMEELPAEVRGLATSLREHSIMAEVREVADGVLAALAEVLRESPSLAEVVERVRVRDALLGKAVRFDDGERMMEGVGAGLREDGALILRMGDRTYQGLVRGSVLPA